MKKKEVKYLGDEGVVREKLMIRRIECGNETIVEADYSCIAANIEELYFLAEQGRRFSVGLLKVWKENSVDDIIKFIRNAHSTEALIDTFCKEFRITKDVAEYLANMRLSEITGIRIEDFPHRVEYFTKAAKNLKELLELDKSTSYDDLIEYESNK